MFVFSQASFASQPASSSPSISQLWVQSADGIVFSISWPDIETRCHTEMDPDTHVTFVQRHAPVEYMKWRLDGADSLAAVVRASPFDTAGCLSFHPMDQCVGHALKGLACRAS